MLNKDQDEVDNVAEALIKKASGAVPDGFSFSELAQVAIIGEVL